MIGQQVAHYQIVEKLGEGGMGVVYKARDTHLDRFVALKFLPPERVADPERKRRFIQEAKAASALNHPNIITIYDIDEAEGAHFIAMEYVEGRTLDQLIPKKGTRLANVLKYGVQIADALSAAHAAGIVHRDLKPGNVMVTGNGLVKVLDFGLAKLTEVAPIEEDEETRSYKPRTEDGQILGTVAYMSPEQGQGKTVDARSDIFSFGSLLYEMVTGRSPFHGDTKMATLAAVIGKEAAPLPAETPHDLGKIITRCLRKDPDKRFHHMVDVRVALEELKEESDSGQLLERPAAPTRRRTMLWALGSAGVVLLSAGLWFMAKRASPAAQPRLAPVTTLPGSEMYPSFSPDGKQIAFSWDGENGANPGIYVKLLGETNALRLTTGADTYPAWAPDGKRIAFVRTELEQGIYTVSALGGTERKLAGMVPTDQMSWSPDGKWLALSLRDEKGRGIELLPVEGGEPRRISNPKAPLFDRSPAFAPDGQRLAYISCTGGFSCDVHVQSFDPSYSPRGGPRPITRQREMMSGLTWSRDGGSLIYATGSLERPVLLSYLWRAGADGRDAPQRLEIAGPMAYSPSASPTADRLLFHRLLRDYDIWRYRNDNRMDPLIVSSLSDMNPQFSPDGTRIAFASSRSGEAMEIWVAQADGTKPVQLTNLAGRHQGSPRWAPDGRWIAFHSLGQDGHWDICVIEAKGGSPRRITSEPTDEIMPSWSRDGKWIYFGSDRTGNHEIWRVPFAGGKAEQATTRGGTTGFESAGGEALFYMKVDSGPLFAKRLPGGEEREMPPYIYQRSFVPVADGIYHIGRGSNEGYYPLEFFQFSSGASKLLAKIEGGVYIGLSVSPDRKTILFTKSVSIGADLMMIENFQ